MANIDKLNKLASTDSKWIEEAKERQKNKGWLKHSQKIAIIVLRTIRELGISQKELAEKMDVSPQMINKIVKGKEKLNLESISKLEDALAISIIFPESNRAIISKEYIVENKFVYMHVYSNKTDLGKQVIPYDLNEVYPQPVLNEPCISYGS